MAMFNFAVTFRRSIASSSQSFQSAKHPQSKKGPQCKGRIKGLIRKTRSQSKEEANNVILNTFFKTSERFKMAPHEPFQTDR